MKHQNEIFQDEISDLKMELEHFQQEKECVRAIIGKIGGVPKFRTKLINAVFVSAIIVCFAVSVLAGEKWRLLMIDLALATLSVKIIYLIRAQLLHESIGPLTSVR